MSTEIKDNVSASDVHTLDHYDPAPGRTTVEFRVRDGRSTARAAMNRPDFLDAIRTELNVIIIDKADLPEVKPSRTSIGTVDGNFRAVAQVTHDDRTVYALPTPDDGADHLRATAYMYLALAEYLDANPPVDEAQVDALARDLTAAEVPGDTRWIARRLVERGVRVEVAS